jgi:L-alanine-DL-glutamate epimerase-like enolase superfamily enzyme
MDRVLTAPFALEDGHVRIPAGPGLGVEVDEDWVRSTAVLHVGT